MNGDLINNTDFAPTLLELAGVEAPDTMQGRSFAAALDGHSRSTDWRTATYYRYWMHLMHHDNPAHFGVRTKDYKLIFYYGQAEKETTYGKPSMPWKKDASYRIEPTPAAWEFYDLRNDPHENRNEYAQPEIRGDHPRLESAVEATAQRPRRDGREPSAHSEGHRRALEPMSAFLSIHQTRQP